MRILDAVLVFIFPVWMSPMYSLSILVIMW